MKKHRQVEDNPFKSPFLFIFTPPKLRKNVYIDIYLKICDVTFFYPISPTYPPE